MKNKHSRLLKDRASLPDFTSAEIKNKLRELELYDLGITRKPVVEFYVATCPFCLEFNEHPLVLDTNMSRFHCLKCNRIGSYSELLAQCMEPILE